VSEEIFKIDKYMAKLQARAWLSHALCAPGQHAAKDEESCGGIFNMHLTANLPRNLPVKFV